MGSRGLRQVLGALDELARAPEPDPAADAVLAASVWVAGADSAVLTRIDERGAKFWVWPTGFLDAGQQAAFEAVNAVHPWPLATHTRRGTGSAMRISDFWSPPQYRSTPMYHEVFRDLGIQHQVAFSLPTCAPHTLCVALQRDGHDFTGTECDDLNALRLCLTTAARRPASVFPLEASSLDPLTLRERDILHLVATGQSDVQIGRSLGISPHTVSKHLQHLYRKIGVSNRTEAVSRIQPLEAALSDSVDAFTSLPEAPEAAVDSPPAGEPTLGR